MPESSSPVPAACFAAVPPPPWRLQGAAIVLLNPAKVLPLLGLVLYRDSPVGSYCELAGVRLAGDGPSVVAMLVNSPLSREGGRRGWGFPKELAALDWQQQAQRVTFRAAGRSWRFRVWGPAFPVRLRGWTVQTHEGRRVRVPVRVQGYARPAFRGWQWALYLPNMQLDVLEPQPLKSGR